MIKIEKILEKECFDIDDTLTDKDSVLRKIAEMAAHCSKLVHIESEKLYESLLQREKLGTTGLGNGIAIPHCVLPDIDEFVLGMLIVPHGIDFDALDGKPVKIFAFIVAPQKRRNDHIRLLSVVAKILGTEPVRKRLLSAKDKDELFEIFSNKFTELCPIEQQRQFYLFNIIVQKDSDFLDILGLLTELPDTSLTIIEAANASNYLKALPLFMSFWGEGKKRFSKIILATIPKKYSNEALRRIKEIARKNKSQSEIMVVVLDTVYTFGELGY